MMKMDEIKKKVEDWQSYFSNNNDHYEINKKFANGGQWDSRQSTYYNSNGRPVLTINLYYTVIRQILAEEKSSLPALAIEPGENVPQKLITIISDYVNNIFSTPDAQGAEEMAAFNALLGYGVLWLDFEKNLNGIGSRIKLRPVRDSRFSVFDPYATEKTKCDGEYSGVFESYSPDMAKKLYGADLKTWDLPYYFDDPMLDTRPVQLLHFYYKDFESANFVKFYDPYSKIEQILTEEDFEQYLIFFSKKVEKLKLEALLHRQMFVEQAISILERSRGKISKVHRVICDRDRILDHIKTDLRLLPVVFVDGDSTFNGKEQILRAFGEEAFDIQRSINYTWSDLMYRVQIARRETITAPDDHLKEYKEIFQNPEKVVGAIPYVEGMQVLNTGYNFDGLQRLWMILYGYIQAFYSVIGRSQAAQGNQSDEVSGIAIQQKIMQQNMSAYGQFKNLFDAVAQVGRVITSAIASGLVDIYNVVNNKKTKLPSSVLKKIFEFEVKLGASPTFYIQKQAERNYLLELVKVNPNFTPYVFDKLIELTDTELTPQLAERAKLILPPEIYELENGKPPPQQPQSSQPSPLEMEMKLKAAELQQKQMALENDAKNSQMQLLGKLIDNESKAKDTESKNFATMAGYAETVMKTQADAKAADQETQRAIIGAVKMVNEIKEEHK